MSQQPPGHSYETDPTLYLFTSLTSGSSQIITATSRMETILKANRIPFRAIDIATDEKARRLWSRRAGGKKIPALVRAGMIIGDLNMIEEWNEFGELRSAIEKNDRTDSVEPFQPSTNHPISHTAHPKPAPSSSRAKVEFSDDTAPAGRPRQFSRGGSSLNDASKEGKKEA